MENPQRFIIHQTDLFRPHEDPDDHWDLSTTFALHNKGYFNLSAVLLDSPADFHNANLPDIASVGLLNRYYNTAVPYGIGGSFLSANRDKYEGEKPAIDLLLKTLRECEGKVSIHICGSCNDVAEAGRIAPELFKEKCEAIYLNAGASLDKAEAEYNVKLNKTSFAEIFSLPTKIYWMPCFEYCKDFFDVRFSEFSTFYRFNQSEILPFLPTELKQYFAFMFERLAEDKCGEFLRNCTGDELNDKMAVYSGLVRNMWCTAGYFHSAGLTVSMDGELIPLSEAGNRAVFSFTPIEIDSINDGIVDWCPKNTADRHFIFKSASPEKYPRAMIRAMKKLLCDD